MASAFIYVGLGILLIGAIFGLYVAIRGFKKTGWKMVTELHVWDNMPNGTASPVMQKLTWTWGGIMAIGFFVVFIGLLIGLM